MACDKRGCLPPNDYAFTAAWSGPVAVATAKTAPAETATVAGSYQKGMNQPTIRGHIEPMVVQPGGMMRLSLTAEPASGWHVYALTDGTPAKVSKPTVIDVSVPAGWTVTKPTASEAPKLKVVAGQPAPERVYEQPVTWTVAIKAPQIDLPSEQTVVATISGLIGYQTCNAGGCMPPNAASFTVQVPVGAAAVEGQVPLAFSPAPYPKESAPATASSESVAFDPSNFVVAADDELAKTPFWQALILGFAGGLILNLMPCVRTEDIVVR
jgi:hypothetical protein